MISIVQAMVLGIVQGITEWLPISSSGHLAIIQNLFGLKSTVFFDILLHVGTLIVILIVFWKDILKILKAGFTLDFKSREGKFAIYIILGSIPTALIGYSFYGVFSSFFYNLLAIGSALLFTGTLLFFSERNLGSKKINWANSLIIGLAQGIAIIPGISRSGSTIGTSLLLKINKEEAIKFSFLLYIPAVIGAAIFEAQGVGVENLSAPWVGMIFAVIVGYFSLKFLLRIIREKKFHVFSYYCWILGVFTILLYFFL